MYPENPPRVRLEWLIATTRVVLAAGAFFAASLGPFTSQTPWLVNAVLGGYLLYSLLVLGLVWTPVRFAAGWDLAVHLFDLLAFSVLSFLTLGTASPFYVYFIFLVICATLRWRSWGAFWTTCASIGVYAVMSAYGANVLHMATFSWNTFAIRSVHLAVVAALVGYMDAYQRQYQREISRLASWPRKIPPDSQALIGEILAESAEILDAPRVLLIWEEPGDGRLNVASRSDGEVTWTQESEANYASVVAPGLEGKSFQTLDAADDNGTVIHGSSGGFRQRRGQPVHRSLQRRFDMRRVQSWSLDGELIRGRLFCLDKPQMRLDDLLFGVLVARLAVSRLDGLSLLKQLRAAAAVDERLRLARDLHDSLLQSVAGTALQLLSARRLLDRQPEAAKQRLEEVQNQLERGELEMRSFIGRLRPLPSPYPIGAGLAPRLEELRSRVEHQWDVHVKVNVATPTEHWPGALANEVYRIVQEGVLNAARHADASIINVDVSEQDGTLHIEIVDDGRGFPFRGTYDLTMLNALNRGPLTLKERVAELQGDLKLRSMETGTELSISLPLAKAAG